MGVVMKILYVAVALLWATIAHALDMDIVYLTIERDKVAVLSNLDPIPPNVGRAGFELGISDNQTTGKFMNHVYVAHTVMIPSDVDPSPFFDQALALSRFVITDLPADVLIEFASRPNAKDALIFNASSQDDDLRSTHCSRNIFHTIPSYAMRSDALAQTLLTKRWTKVAMIHDSFPQDQKFADALRRSFTKFGLKLRSEKQWNADADIRRTAASEIPVFTQDMKDHDVMVIVDELDDFGRYVPFNTWLARPVAGTQGLRPVGWDRTAEQWGAAQLQSRFNKAFERPMRPLDYAAWVAVRTLGEAMTRTKQSDAALVRQYILSDDFELAAFKGRPLSYRAWNGQLRQPMPVVGPTAVVANAPLDGFLHQHNELDTLGLDQAESKCFGFEE
jgi:ABC transporter substrate binding protein (PQQ-dependent alcohol dehydrogenase system)